MAAMWAPAPPPADREVRKAIDSLAVFVARSGDAVEAIAKERMAGDARMAFLFGGEGAAYYKWKVGQLKAAAAGGQVSGGQAFAVPVAATAIGRRPSPLTTGQRGSLLGEIPLPSAPPSQHQPPRPPQQQQLARSLMQVAEADRARLQAALGSMFVRGEAQTVLPAEEGGLQEGLRPGAPRVEPPSGPALATRLVTPADLSRPAAAAEHAAAQPSGAPLLPIRRLEEWRPAPLLCKRVDVPDPYKHAPKQQVEVGGMWQLCFQHGDAGQPVSYNIIFGHMWQLQM
jgi:G patch domain-containing protein 1